MKAMRKFESAEYEAEQMRKKEEKRNIRPLTTEIQKFKKDTKYTPDELYSHAIAYFTECENTVVSKDKNGNEVKKPKTRSGLCLYLHVGNDYISEKAKDERFAHVIGYIRQTTANNLEEGMLTGQYNASGAIFSLKNHEKWTDRVQMETTVDNNITITFKE